MGRRRVAAIDPATGKTVKKIKLDHVNRAGMLATAGGIVMTGGGALIRGLDVLLTQETGLPIHVDEDPLTCVVRGTGRILDDEEKYWSVLST